MNASTIEGGGAALADATEQVPATTFAPPPRRPVRLPLPEEKENFEEDCEVADRIALRRLQAKLGRETLEASGKGVEMLEAEASVEESTPAPIAKPVSLSNTGDEIFIVL